KHLLAEQVKIVDQGTYAVLKDLLDQSVFVLIVAIECCTAHHGTAGNLPYGQGVKTTLFDQGQQRLPQEFLRPPHAQIAGVLRHVASSCHIRDSASRLFLVPNGVTRYTGE